MLSNKTYDFLKWIVLVVLPGLGTLYSLLAVLWGFPYAEQIVGTITGVATFLGTILGISSAQYSKKNVKETIKKEE